MAGANRGPSPGGGEARDSEAAAPTNDGICVLGNVSNPGGREIVEEVGVIMFRACLAPAEAVLSSKGVMVMALELSPP
jgi:hypothetical protein